MESNSSCMLDPSPTLASSSPREILYRLAGIASTRLSSELDPLAARLADAFLTAAEIAIDAKDANLCFNAGNLLKNHGYPFFHVASEHLRLALENEVATLLGLDKASTTSSNGELSLVAFSEMDDRLRLARAARSLELANADLLTALNLRLASMLGREQIITANNPFRPALILAALDRAWREYDPHPESHHLLLLQFDSGMMLDFAPLLQALNQACIDAGIMPKLANNYPIHKSAGNRNPAKEPAADPALLRQLRQLFSAQQSAPAADAIAPDGFPVLSKFSSLQDAVLAPPAGVITPALASWLSELQLRLPTPGQALHDHAGGSVRLSDMARQMPRDAMTRADETTVDVMTRIFEAVFRHPDIAQEMKDLIGVLQIPVLKAALIDKEFFFEETHPARRLISLLTRSSIGWDRSKGRSDPLYQAIERNVGRAREFDTQISLFDELTSDLEAFLNAEDSESAVRLAAPITLALNQEKLQEATRLATSDVAVRIASGEVATFVEAFLESRWVPVLTLAYSVKDEKPHVLQSAIKTMDELIWSVQPKITMAQRKELVAKLPSMLTTLNKWLNVLKWEDADRLHFFADLAECHASIVRAPLELSPHRQLELAVEAARVAAERRLEKRTAQVEASEPAPDTDAATHQVDVLERGMWFEFVQPDASLRKVKLAWISPLKSLYIFTTFHREEAFSMAAEVLMQAFREQRVNVVEVSGFVNQALTEVFSAAPVDTATT